MSTSVSGANGVTQPTPAPSLPQHPSPSPSIPPTQLPTLAPSNGTDSPGPSANPRPPATPHQLSVNGNGSSHPSGPMDAQAMHTRLVLAQQAMQANMRQQQPQTNDERPSSSGGPTERRSSGSGTDWTAMVNQLIGEVPGATPEAIMKQLQALQNSKARLAAAGNTPIPSIPPLPTPTAASTSLPLEQQNATAGPSRSPSAQPPASLPEGDDAGAASTSNGAPPTATPAAPSPVPNDAQPVLVAQQEKARQPPPARPPPSAPANSSASQPRPPPAPGQAGPGRPSGRMSVADQRKQFLHTLVGMHKQNNTAPPRAIFNGERDGSFKIGDVWLDAMELFMAVLKTGGVSKVASLPPDSPFWTTFLTAKNIPNPLAAPLPLPRAANMDPNAPPHMTNNPITYLLGAYAAWLQPFEEHMQRQRTAVMQRQAAAGGARPPTASANGAPQASTPVSAPSPALPMTPASAQAPTPGPLSAPTPSAMNHVSPAPLAGSPAPMNVDINQAPRPKSASKPIPPPIKVETNGVSPAPHSATSASGKKRKRDKSGVKPSDASAPPTPLVLPNPTPSAPPPRPPTPKRARYKVEYRPFHFPQPALGGWDERAVASTFPKHNLHQPPKSIHELGIVDLEAVLMGLRSRLPQQLGYALTVLSMLSMPLHEEGLSGLPLVHIRDILVEVLELLQEAAFGEEGYQVWASRRADEDQHLDMTYADLESLAEDVDYGFKPRKDATGGSTDIILCCLNMLRNFSIVPANVEIMSSYPMLFELLATLPDARLARFDLSADPTFTHDASADFVQRPESNTDKPFSVVEHARVRRECVSILSNLGLSLPLAQLPPMHVSSLMRLISSFLLPSWETLARREPIYGPSIPLQSVPPAFTPSLNKALEALCKICLRDENREVLSHLPAPTLVSLFDALVKLLPHAHRQLEALRLHEDFLAYNETLVLSLYSLAFASPPSVRASLRSLPGVVPTFIRLICLTAQGSARAPDWRQNAFNVICRRMVETLGVLNGTVTPNASGEIMSFSSGGVEGKGWKFANKVVEDGWLAAYSERMEWVLGFAAMDGVILGEVEGLLGI